VRRICDFEDGFVWQKHVLQPFRYFHCQWWLDGLALTHALRPFQSFLLDFQARGAVIAPPQRHHVNLSAF
jgi:hypothetical protein